MNAARRFQYSSGEVVLAGDAVSLKNKTGVVAGVLQPGEPQAFDYSCGDTGGVLVAFSDGDLQLWPDLDEDLAFVSRGTPPPK
jgi:hypothetical protein